MKKKLLKKIGLILSLSFATCLLPAQTSLVVLGSGNPNPDPDHQGPGVAVVVGDQAYLVDFGVGIVRQAAALSPKYQGRFEALDAKNLDKAFLTHLHADHSMGLPDLILTPWIMGREKPLKLWGPIGVQHMADNILEAYQEDIKYRIYGLQPANNSGWQVQTHEIQEPGTIYRDELVIVEAIAVEHGTWPQCFAYKFTTADKVIVVSGDTKPTENLVKFAKGADILVHEVYSFAGWKTKTPFWQKYHKENHTSSFELAELAERIQPGLMVLYHTLYWGSTNEDILEEIARTYKGAVVIGKDLGVYECLEIPL